MRILFLVFSVTFSVNCFGAEPIKASKNLIKEICKSIGNATNIKEVNWNGQSLKLNPNDWITTEYQPALAAEGEYRWVQNTNGKFYLERKDYGKDFYSPPIEFSSCTAQTSDKIVILKCSSSSLLYNDKKLIAVSVEDYSEPKTKIIGQLDVDKKPAWLVELGIKAGTVWYLIPKFAGDFSPKKCKEEVSDLS